MANLEQINRLKQSASAWNKWRIENPNIKIDLTKADLRDAKIQGANLAYADLKEADLRGANIRGTKFTHASLSKAKLQNTKCGIEPSWYVLILASSLILPLISSIFFVFTGRLLFHLSEGIEIDTDLTVPSFLFSLPAYFFLIHKEAIEKFSKIFLLQMKLKSRTISSGAKRKKKRHAYQLRFSLAIVLLAWIMLLIGPFFLIVTLINNPLGLVVSLVSITFHTLPYAEDEDSKILIGLIIHLLLMVGFFYFLESNSQEITNSRKEYFNFIQSIRRFYILSVISLGVGTCFSKANLSNSNFSFSCIRFANFQDALISQAEFYKVLDPNLAIFNNNFYMNRLNCVTALEYEKIENHQIPRKIYSSPLTGGPKYIRYFRGLELSNLYLGISKLYGDERDYVSDLRMTDFEHCTLVNVVFSYALLADSSFKNADLRYSNFRGSDLRGVNFEGALLKHSTLEGAVVENCNFKDAVFYGADLSGLSLASSSFENSSFVKANLSNVYLERANITSVDFRSAIFSDANLSRANLSKSNLDQAVMKNVNLQNADLSNASFKGSQLQWTSFRRSKLSNSFFDRAVCRNVDFAYADISNSSFIKTNLRESNLFAVQALGTNFSQADFTAACISDWQIGSLTKLDEVKCQYIFRTIEKNAFSGRLPIDLNNSFAPGEFTKRFQIIASALETIDLTYTEGVDWHAFFKSFQELRAQYADQKIFIQGVEEKDNAVIVRLQVDAEESGPDLEKLKGEIETKQKALYKYQLQLIKARGKLEVYEDMMGVVKALALKPITEVSQIFHGPVGNVAGTNQKTMTSYINQNNDDIIHLLTTLREKAQQFPNSQKDDVLMELDDLESDLKILEKRDSKRIGKRFKRLLAAGTAAATLASEAATVSGNINEFSSNVLELAEKVGLSRDAL